MIVTVCVCLYICLFVCLYVCVRASVCKHIYVCMCVCVYVCACVHVRVYVGDSIYMYHERRSYIVRHRVVLCITEMKFLPRSLESPSASVDVYKNKL